MHRIGVIFNPFAGGNKANATVRQAHLEKILGNRGVVRATRSLEELGQVAQEFYEQEIPILAISGGDGTNHKVLTTFHNVYKDKELPLLAMLRGGTMNLLETSLGMYGSPEKRLQSLVKVVESGQYPIITHTMLCVNGKFGYIFGNGVIANFLEQYYGSGNPNFKQAITTFGKALWAAVRGKKQPVHPLFAPIQAHVQVGENMLPDKSFLALMAATERECGLGFKPFYRAREEQGKFHFLAMNLEPKEVLQNLPKIRTGKRIGSADVYDVVTDSVHIETFVPYHYTIDGEMLNSTRHIHLSSGPVVKIIAV